MNAHLPAIHDKEALYAAGLAKVAPAENERAAIRDGRPVWRKRSDTAPAARPTPAHIEEFRRKRRDAALAAMTAAGEWLTLPQIAAALNVQPDSARDTMVALLRQGLVSRRIGHIPGNTRLAEWRAGQDDGIAVATTRALVLAHMRATPDRWATAEVIAREIGRATCTVKTAMGELERDGLMERISGRSCKGGSRPSLWRAAQAAREAHSGQVAAATHDNGAEQSSACSVPSSGSQMGDRK